VSFLLDTNVLSEGEKLRPDPGVVAWIDQTEESLIFVSVISIAEIRHGIQRLANGSRRTRLERWLRDNLTARFKGRILLVDERIANVWGEIVAERDVLGRPIGVMDAFIAATARVHGLTLVTRDAADFAPSVASLLNPWQA
jgi:toxin FitB